MFINDNDNRIKDDEVEENKPKKKFNFFKNLSEKRFQKNYANPNYDSNDGGLDFNNKFLNNNKNNGNFLRVIETIICFIVFVLIIVFVVPRLLHYDISNKKEYVNRVNEMVDQVIAYYAQPGLKCTTSTKDVYYFTVNNSSQMFGKNIKSPFINNPLQGYVEFDMNENGYYEVYVSFTDGVFGFDRVKYSELKPSNVRLFTYLSIDKHMEMTCNKQFVFSN